MFDNLIRHILQNPDRIVGPFLQPGMNAIDIGCGTGYFTTAIARCTAPGGIVTAVDLQQEMLDVVREKTRREGLEDRVRFHRCREDTLGLGGEPAGFALAFWMAHEVPDQDRFFREVAAALTPGGKFLVAEPILHVSSDAFEETLARARKAGFTVAGRPGIFWSRAAVLEKEGNG